LLSSAIALSGCSGRRFIATSWPGLTVDQNTAYLAYNQHVYAIELDNGRENWRFPTEPDNSLSFYAPPTLTDDGQLLVGGYDNALYSLNPESGEVNWTFDEAKNRFIDGPLVLGQTIYAPSADETLYVLGLDGSPLDWTFSTRHAQWAKPATDGETLYISSMDHHLYALDPQTGTQLWAKDLGGAIAGTPTLSDDGTSHPPLGGCHA